MSKSSFSNLTDFSEQAVQTRIAEENPLTYADLLCLEWVLEDKIGEWEWRDDGLDDLIESGRGTLGRVREAVRNHECDNEGGEI